MRAQEIISAIEWPEAMPADRRNAVEDAIRALDAKAFGNVRPTHNAAVPFKKLEAFVVKAGTAAKAAELLGVSPGFLSQMRNSTRPIPARVLGQLGLVRAPRGREQYLEL